MNKSAAILLCLFLLITPARAAWAPLVYVRVSEAQLSPGMLFELQVSGDAASAIALQLPPEIQQIELPTIEPGNIFVPLAVGEDAPPGVYTIRAVVMVQGSAVAVSVDVRVGAAEAPVWRVVLPLVRR